MDLLNSCRSKSLVRVLKRLANLLCSRSLVVALGSLAFAAATSSASAAEKAGEAKIGAALTNSGAGVGKGLLATNNSSAAAASPSAGAGEIKFSSEMIARGKKIYRTFCLQCHNADPRKPGSQGPDVYGSSLALLEAKILKNQYPPGYKPKRNTRNMIPLAHVKKEIPNIHAYLNSPLD